MRPPSYYSSLANSQPQRGSTNSSLQLRSSFSSPSSSSYATRNHLPFVSQSMLVAHCYTGTTRPYGSHSTGSNTSLGSYNNSYSRPRSTKSHTNPYLAAPSYSSSSLAHSSPSYSSASSSAASLRYLSGTSSSLTRSALRPTASSSYRSSYTPSSAYYKPIRLRERPLLNQISRQINAAESPRPKHSQSDLTASGATVRREPSEEAGRETKEEEAAEESWQSDVARNISRNKYLIKFREIDKRASPTPIQLTNRVEQSSSEPLVDKKSEQSETKAERFEERSNEEVISKSMKVPVVVPALVERLEEKPAQVGSPKPADSARLPRPVLTQIENSVGKLVDSDTASANQEANLESKEAEKGSEASKSIKKKVPREKKNIKLRIKSLNKNGEQVDDAQRVTSKVKKTASPKQSPEEISSDTSPAVKTKVKRLVKTSKRSEIDHQVSPDEQKLILKESEKGKRASDAHKTKPPKQVEKVGSEEAESTKLTTSKLETTSQPSKVELKQSKREVIEQDKSALSSPEVSTTSVNKRIRFREYRIDDFNFLSVLGHGGWGFVILADLKGHDACFAVKCIKKITIVEDDDFDSIMIERKVLTLGNVHPFICKLFCTFETDGYLFFVMEYCPGGDLMFHVQKEGKFSESRCRFYAAEIICAIRFLHNQHIIYRDLKLDNILLDAQGHIRLVDFGMCQCRTYREEMLPSNFCGTPEYISPEIIKGVPYNHSVDWWSFGVLLYEMAVGKMPFRGNDENELLWNVCYEQIHYPMFLSKELTTLLQSLLEREPTKRMGMATCKMGDIYEQAWFRGVDWAAIEKMRIKPPFVPEVLSKRDVQNFDADFTESAPELSPVDEATLQKIDQKQFQKFPYTNPNIFIFD